MYEQDGRTTKYGSKASKRSATCTGPRSLNHPDTRGDQGDSTFFTIPKVKIQNPKVNLSRMPSRQRALSNSSKHRRMFVMRTETRIEHSNSPSVKKQNKTGRLVVAPCLPPGTLRRALAVPRTRWQSCRPGALVEPSAGCQELEVSPSSLSPGGV